MAPILLDGRTSQNAGIANSINIPTTAAYALWGQVGLDVSAANPSFPIRVQFSGSIALRLSPAHVLPLNTLEVKVVRGSVSTDPLIYTAVKTLTADQAVKSELLTFVGSDYNVPKGNGSLIYTVFVRNVSGSNESDVRRPGPESFNVLAIGN